MKKPDAGAVVLPAAPPPQDVELNAVLEAVDAALDGAPVSDFMESFPIVRKALDSELRYRLAIRPDCPHCGLPFVMPEICTPELNEKIEAAIAKDWSLLGYGVELGKKFQRAAAVPPPAPEPETIRALIDQFRRQAAALEFGQQKILTGSHATIAETQAKVYRACADELDALIAAAGSPQTREAWQLIETVPDDVKDAQQPILLWTPNTAVVGSFDNDEWYILGSRYVIEATHWMPLPAPPVPPQTREEKP